MGPQSVGGPEALAWSREAAGDYWSARINRVGQLEAVLALGGKPQRNTWYDLWTLEATRKLLSLAPGFRTCLDVGCGFGRALPVLRQAAEQVTGVDVAPAMVERARALDYTHVVLGDGHDLPFAAESFDLVVCLGVLEHIPTERLPLVVAELARVLRPGGVLVLETNNGGGRITKLPPNEFRLGRQLANGYVAAEVDQVRLQKRLLQHGLRVERRLYNPLYSVARRFTALGPRTIEALIRIELSWLMRLAPVRRVSDQVVFRARKAAS